MTTATATTLISEFSDVPQYSICSLPIEKCVYRGEGNANLVIALPSERKVIRLRKSLSAELMLEENARRVCREVDFIRDVISDFFGCYVCVPEILQLDQAEITRLSEKIHLSRPENRRSKEIIGGYVTKFPDYTFLPEHLFGFSNKSTYCVEIKPKQGFLCKADRQFKKCPYCLTQYYKKHNGRTRESSNYCPFDLFSGQEVRMERALEALLRSPQNNLRIFKDGILVYDEALVKEGVLDQILTDWFSNDNPQFCQEVFLRLTRHALTHPFDFNREVSEVIVFEAEEEFELPYRLDSDLVKKVRALFDLANEQECQLSGISLPVGSVLERILRMQRVHRCGVDVVAWIYAKFSAIFSDELIHADFTRSSNVDASTRCHATMDLKKIEDKKKKQLCDLKVQDSGLESELNAVSDLDEDSTDINNQREQALYTKIVNKKFLKNITINDMFNILKNYLLFCMARDCSILIAFQEVDKELPKNIDSQHQIQISRDQRFLVNVRILDLDMKSVCCIEKHCRRDNDVLQAVKEELEKKLAH